MALLAQARLPQLLQGCKVYSALSSFSSEHITKEEQHKENRPPIYQISLSRLDDDQRAMKALSVLEEIAMSISPEEMKEGKLIIHTVKQDGIIKRLLRAEVYPPISFTERVGM